MEVGQIQYFHEIKILSVSNPKYLPSTNHFSGYSKTRMKENIMIYSVNFVDMIHHLGAISIWLASTPLLWQPVSPTEIHRKDIAAAGCVQSKYAAPMRNNAPGNSAGRQNHHLVPVSIA